MWTFIETPYPEIEDNMWQHAKLDYHIQCAEDGSYVLWFEELVGYTSENGHEYNYYMVAEFADLESAMDHVDTLITN